MGLKRRTFWQWLKNAAPEPQYWEVTAMIGEGPGSVACIKPTNKLGKTDE